MKKNITILTGIILLLVWGCVDLAFAERKPLMEPDTLSFDPKDELSLEYKEKIAKLKKGFERLGDSQLVEKADMLYENLRRNKADGILKSIKGGLNKYKDKELYEELTSLMRELELDVEEWRYSKGRMGVDFKADKKKREYVVSWGRIEKEVIRVVPMVPKMDIVLKAQYVPLVKGNSTTMAYRYWLENGKRSGGAVSRIRMPSAYPVARMEQEYHSLYLPFNVSDTIKITISPPRGKKNSFTFSMSNRKTGDLVDVHPGHSMEFPYELKEIGGGLPGIVRSYVPVSGYNPFIALSGEDGRPEMARDIFAVSGNLMYQGNTIGPVPAPVTFNSSEFIDTIISYNEQGIEEGWNDRPPVIKFTREGLSKIKAAPADKGRIDGFLEKLDKYYKKKQILSEAYALLRYNLEYLRSKI